jgi:hypothetical protein
MIRVTHLDGTVVSMPAHRGRAEYCSTYDALEARVDSALRLQRAPNMAPRHISFPVLTTVLPELKALGLRLAASNEPGHYWRGPDAHMYWVTEAAP